jgi:hypothetical protein
MSYHAPDGWRVPVHAPQHATAFGDSRPVRIHVHRVMRLLAAAAAWAAGLCLVTGSVALVAEAAGPAGTTHVTAAAGVHRLRPGSTAGAGRPVARGRTAQQHGQSAQRGQSAQHGPSTPLGQPAPAGHPVRVVEQTFQGAGNQTTALFTVAPRSRWELQWSYTCARGAVPGRLLIREGGTGQDGISVAASGTAGQGSTWTYTTTAAHYLVVIADCGWTIRVTGIR